MLKTACSCIVVLFAFCAKAQQLPLETYTPANGLVDARINKIFQDSKGRIYFLTREGFSIFDGQRFDNYGISNNQSTEIFNAITTYSDGSVKLFSFDGNTYTVSNNKITIDSSQKNILLETNKVFDISTDEKLILTNSFLLKEKNGHYQKLELWLAGPEDSPRLRYLCLQVICHRHIASATTFLYCNAGNQYRTIKMGYRERNQCLLF